MGQYYILQHRAIILDDTKHLSHDRPVIFDPRA